MAEETDLMVVGERKRREEEKKRLEEIISRDAPTQGPDEEKKSYKKEIEERIASQKEKEATFRAALPNSMPR